MYIKHKGTYDIIYYIVINVRRSAINVRTRRTTITAVVSVVVYNMQYGARDSENVYNNNDNNNNKKKMVHLVTITVDHGEKQNNLETQSDRYPTLYLYIILYF